MSSRVLVVALALVLSAELVGLEVASGQPRVGAVLRSVGEHATAVGNFARLAGSSALLMALLSTPLDAMPVPRGTLQNEDMKGWNAVTDAEPDAFRSIFYVVAKGATHYEQPMRDVAYIGDFQGGSGDAMLLGNQLHAFLQKNAATEFALYSRDGLLLDNVQFTKIAIFPTSGAEFTPDIHIVEGLQLATDYTPLSMSKFPVNAVDEELLAVSYWHAYKHNSHHDVAPIWRSCEVKPGGWEEADIGNSNCFPNGAPKGIPILLAESLQLVGFHGVGFGFELVPVGGITQDVLTMMTLFDLINTNVVTPPPRSVDTEGVLATTWGRIKSAR